MRIAECGFNCGFVFALLVGGCAAAPQQQDSRAIRDLTVLPQDAAAYLGADADKPLLSDQQAAGHRERFLRMHYAPWDAPAVRTSVDDVRQPFLKYQRETGFGENLRPHSPAWAAGLLDQAELDRFASKHTVPAIAVRNGDLRQLPTNRVRFDGLEKPGDFYPFDTLQESAVWAGTPLRVWHLTRDQAWAFVECGFSQGWMDVRDLAYVSPESMTAWRSARPLAVVADGAAVHDEAGLFRFQAWIGAIFPAAPAAGASGKTVILVPVADEHRRAVLMPAPVPAAAVAPWPLPATPRQLAALANQMLGQPYGWGGMYEHRDCSSMVRDLFVPLAMWLPRNSGEQARAGELTPLRDLPPDQRERAIIAKGVPWLTLVRAVRASHVMLYLGRRDGRAIIMHHAWGPKVRLPDGREGQHVIGRCVITTLQPGIELPNLVQPQGDLRTRVESMTRLGEP